MNTDPRRAGGQTPDDEPVVIGAGLRPVEDRLRQSLDSEARSITPGDRPIATCPPESRTQMSRPMLLPTKGMWTPSSQGLPVRARCHEPKFALSTS